MSNPFPDHLAFVLADRDPRRDWPRVFVYHEWIKDWRSFYITVFPVRPVHAPRFCRRVVGMNRRGRRHRWSWFRNVRQAGYRPAVYEEYVLRPGNRCAFVWFAHRAVRLWIGHDWSAPLALSNCEELQTPEFWQALLTAHEMVNI